jgi:hypothetical protein
MESLPETVGNVLVQKDVELGELGFSKHGSQTEQGHHRSRETSMRKAPRSHLDYDYNEESNDLIADIAGSTNSLIFSKFWTSIILSHLVVGAQISAAVVVLQVPYEVYHYKDGAGSWLTLFGVLLTSSEVFNEWNDLSRHIGCYIRQSRTLMALTSLHLLMVTTMAVLVPIVICKVLAAADYNDPLGVLTGFTGIFILFDADGQLFAQLHYEIEDSRVSTNKLKDLRKVKTPLVLLGIPLLIFVVFEAYFMARKHCGDIINGDTATSACHDADDS